jgi:hypothetical protein
MEFFIILTLFTCIMKMQLASLLRHPNLSGKGMMINFVQRCYYSARPVLDMA